MKLEIKDEQGRIDVVLSKMLDESRSKIQRKIKDGKKFEKNVLNFIRKYIWDFEHGFSVIFLFLLLLSSLLLSTFPPMQSNPFS